MEKGNLSINSENILPIIKKWLYSDKDIFIRELISNGCDAVTKLQKLKALGEASYNEDEKFKIEIIVDEKNKTIRVIDNGLGMTADEIKQYINQIAFSGAEDFLNKYKDKMDQENEIIGHFGLGFYSAFMVAEKVEIDSLSYQEGAEAAHWICNGGIDFELDASEKQTRGTEITLYLMEDEKEFLNEYTLRQTIKKYCSFMPVEIYMTVVKEEEEKEETQEAEKMQETEAAEETPETEEIQEEEEAKPLNNTVPLWMKAAKDCTDEEYREFYHDVFMDFKDPLFWIHLNMDYPFRLKGILYFPKYNHEMEQMEGQVKLYNNQVYVADNIKEVVPEFLLLLKGCLDCPDLPLNVSRSFLQNDGYATKMSGYITRKVADKLNALYKNEKENFEKFWDDIQLFVKYGCLKEEKFFDKMKDVMLYKSTRDDYVTLKEYLERNKEKNENKVFYVTDEKQQSQYVNLFKEQSMEALYLTHSIDTPFISFLEMKEGNVSFLRIDSDLSDSLIEKKDETVEDLSEAAQTLFRKMLTMDALQVKCEHLKSKDISAIFLLSEQERRMRDMSKMFGDKGMPFPIEDKETLVINTNNGLVQKLFAIKDDESKNDDIELVCRHIYDLAALSYKTMEADEMSKFIERSNRIMEKVI